MAKQNKIEIVGKTEDNKLVIKGIYYLMEERGIPLSLIISEYYKNDIILDYDSLVLEMVTKTEMKFSTIMNKLKEGIVDSLGIKYYDEVIKRLVHVNVRKD